MQDSLNILTGSLLENEQDGDPVMMRDEEQLSDEGLTDDEWKKHLFVEEPVGKHAHNQSACLLRLSYQHRPRRDASKQCF